ncbi:hypothetical protein CcaverHIS002_0107110 [Cutaneotrichosporon cavernicola]|nr:hypothetical protein CcaverHIS002_0107110 [Cutaneotrichosporon cavernicola]
MDNSSVDTTDGPSTGTSTPGIGHVKVPPIWRIFTVDDAVWLMWIILLGIPATSFVMLSLGYYHPLFYKLIGPCLTLAAALGWAVYLSPASKVDLSGDIVLITGGATGLGFELARKVLKRGATVVVLCHHEPAEKEPGVKYYLCDVSDRATVARVAKVVREEVGHPSIVVNNAGVVNGKLLLDLTEEEIKNSFGVNAMAAFWVTQEYLPPILRARRGHIVNVSSVLGLIGVAQCSDYCASKAATVAFHQSLRNEIDYRYDASEVRTTLVLPGHILTRMFTKTILPSSFFLRLLTPSLTPSEVADAIVGALGGGRANTVLRLPLFTQSARLLNPSSALVPDIVLRLSHWVSGADWAMTHYGPRPDAGQRLELQRAAKKQADAERRATSDAEFDAENSQPKGSRASTTTAAGPVAPAEDAAERSEGGEAAPEPEGVEPTPPSFPAIVTTLTTPATPTEPLVFEHHVLFNHLATSFVPANQPSVLRDSGRDRPSIITEGPRGVFLPQAGHHNTAEEAPANSAVEDPVIALVSPFEGGDAYISRAVHEVAGHLSADVVRLDVALGVGFDGPYAPLAETGITAPPIAQASNPLFQTPPAADHGHHMMEEEEVGGEEEEQNSVPNMVRIPLMAAIPGGSPFGMPGPTPRRPENEEEWVSFFTGLINLQVEGQTASANRRIILLESTAALAETFDVWWPHLLEAVRRRRRPVRKGKKSATLQPTTIVLSIPPSLLLPHTAYMSEPGGETAAEEGKDRLRSVVEALGASVNAIHVDGGADRAEEKLWFSSEEHDIEGRQRREERRLRAILHNGAGALLPFDASSSQQQQPSSHPILDMLMGRNKKNKDGSMSESIVWKTLAIVPSVRDTTLEQHERTRRRRALNAAIMMRAVGQLGATLEEPLSMLEAPDSTPPRGRQRRLQRLKEPDPEWSELVIAWKDAVDLASTAVGKAAISAEKESDKLVLKWKDIQEARAIAYDHERQVTDTVSQYLAASDIAHAKMRQKQAKTDTPADPVVETLKKSKDLNKHEKRLLSCIVDQQKLASSSFKDVHLPFNTIDAIRTVISLPLLFPDAFQGGILKDHVTSGALLFGPPGTGKTLLARAIAAESGARMLAIQPSDVNDMWVGEGEKLVKAVFSIARRLSPCVVFIDEVDSLFGARSARDSSGGSKAHNQILTEFMQEMDGLSSANANRDKRVVVLGATNRPFDLDDAVLRRLPRRLLVDLPTEEDRKAILNILLRNEKLASDVDIDAIAKKTEGFSGSDLKHLCVAAALAAVKEMVVVPWKSALSGSSTPAAVQTSSTGHGPGARQDLPLAVEEEPVNDTHEVKTIPQTPQASAEFDFAVDFTANNSPAAKLVEEAYLKQLEAQAKNEADTRAAETAEGAEEGEGALETPSETPRPSYADRVVHAKHFDTALTEIRPSSSEEGTLPELRKWAEQYGEGGKKAGKKSGFGKGFGFGELPLEKRKGFGRVKADE